MKKNLKNIIFVLIVFIPFINVNAISCRGETKETAIDLKNISSFSCSEIEGDKLTFTNNGNDVSKYFEMRDDKTTIDIIDTSLTFSSEIEYGIVNISDGDKSTNIFIKNSAYVEPTTTTTTKDASVKTLTVTLDPNDGGEVSTKTCEVNSVNTTCNVTLPKIDKETFSGWGTAKTCKTGNTGTIRVEKDITYFACYTDNENESTENSDGSETSTVLLKTLSLKDKSTGEEIKFGTFSIKNTKYDVKVLNNVENIDVVTETEENIKVEVIGNENLKVGENKILIKLTDDNNNQNEYTINVTRLEEGETLNNIHYLKSLVVGGYENELNFDKERLVYTLTIPSNVNKLLITALAEEDEYVPEILNNENLVDGSQIMINITDENNNTTSYVINIVKEGSMNYLLIGAIGLIVVLIIILIVLIIVKSKKNKKTKPSKKTRNDIEVLNI